MSSNSAEIFRLRLRAARVRSALSQKDLADKLGVAQPTISTWEKGVASPRKRQLRKLVGILDLSLTTGNENSPGVLIPSFSQWLKQTRIARGISVRKLAEKAKISAPAIYYIENGRTRVPHPRTVQALKKSLELPDFSVEASSLINEIETMMTELRSLLDGPSRFKTSISAFRARSSGKQSLGDRSVTDQDRKRPFISQSVHTRSVGRRVPSRDSRSSLLRANL